MSTVLFLLMLTVFLAALGRSVTPRAERLPWLSWTARDLAANVARGVRVLCQPNPRHRHLWDAHLDEPPSRQRRADDPGRARRRLERDQ